jgi:hypothetical protein
MRQAVGIYRSVFAALGHPSLVGVFVIAMLSLGALLVSVGTVIGLISFRDVGYPDSATLLRIDDLFRSGHLYPDINKPPYLVTMYGPLTYVLLGIPYTVAQAAGLDPQLLVRLGVVGAVCVCLLLVFSTSWQMHRSRPVAWLCILFAVSTTPLAQWTTQIRGDFLAVGCSLASIYLLMSPNRNLRVLGSSIFAGIAILIKSTFISAPVAIVLWCLYKRQYREGALWVAVFACLTVGGYAIALWREPLMLDHLMALRHPVLEYRGALELLWVALSQPVVPFAALGFFLIVKNRATGSLLFALYWLTSWAVAIITIVHVGANINYFWEPLLSSAVLAGAGLYDLCRKDRRVPVVITWFLLLLLVRAFSPTLKSDIYYLRISYATLVDYKARKAGWDGLEAIVTGRRFLSTIPDLATHASPPEVMDPYLNASLALGGTWSFAPIVAKLDTSAYDFVAIESGQASGVPVYRGLEIWSEEMWSALKRSYTPSCVFDGIAFWLPKRDPTQFLSDLAAIGCKPS